MGGDARHHFRRTIMRARHPSRVLMKARGKTAHRGVPGPPLNRRKYGLHRGVPGSTLCPSDLPAARRLPHNVQPGNPRGETIQFTSPGNQAGRRRAIGVVAVLQSSFARPRRWCDAGSPKAAQKAGVPGNRPTTHDSRLTSDHTGRFRISPAISPSLPLP